MVTGKPVTGKTTGYRFQFLITGYRFTDIFSSRNAIFGFTHSYRRTKTGLHWTQTYRRHPTARYRLFMFTQYLTVESAPLPSPRRVAAAGKGGKGKRCELDGRRGLQRPRVQLAASFDLIIAAYAGNAAAGLTSTDFPGLRCSSGSSLEPPLHP